MFRQFFADVALYDLPLIAMAIFGAIFLTVLVRVCQRSRASEYDRMASLPLDHDRPSQSE
ncbi:MAG: hypothetical protein JNL08_21315 [Planctomycetes bacterium]|nr:hypothetical protein [Planctomycetota bacterium]